MKKSELVDALAGAADLSKAQAEAAIDALPGIVLGELNDGGGWYYASDDNSVQHGPFTKLRLIEMHRGRARSGSTTDPDERFDDDTNIWHERLASARLQ